MYMYTVEPLYSGHCWGMAFWLLYGGGCCRGVSSFRAATVGEWHFGCYTEVAVVEG